MGKGAQDNMGFFDIEQGPLIGDFAGGPLRLKPKTEN